MINRYVHLRYGSKSSCFYCGIESDYTQLTKDHFWPKSKGGRLIVMSCRFCNKRKGRKHPIEWIKHIAILHKLNYYSKTQMKRGIRNTYKLWSQINN